MWYFPDPALANRPALQYGNQQLSYAEMADAVSDRVNWLNSLGVSRVAIALDNCIEWVLFDLACQQARHSLCRYRAFLFSSSVITY